MPWHIEKNGNEFCVIKDADGTTVKCHPTKQEAQDHMAALYANEPGKAISKRPDVTAADRQRAQGEYGNVEYADSVNKKYPIDTEEHIRAAWNYIGQAKNQAQYSAAEVATIKRKIIAAWKKKIDPEGPPGAKAIELDEIKAGARHSAADMQALQSIHDAAINLGAACPQPKGEITEYALMSADLVSFGTEVKALGDGKVAGYLVRYGDPANKDLTGEYFTPDTDFGDNARADVYYQHGADKKLGKRKLTKGDLSQDEIGIWIEAQLSMRDEYEKAVYKLAEAGKLGWSSGTAAHLTLKDEDGRITKWPLGLDASLTPTPAEPRNTAVIPLKSYIESLQVVETEEAEGTGDVPPIEETPTLSISQEQLDQIIEAATVKAVGIAVPIVLAELHHKQE